MNAEELLARLKRVPVKVTLSFGDVWLIPFASEDYVRSTQIEYSKDPHAFAKIVQMSVVEDEGGKLAFTVDQVPELAVSHGTRINEIAEAVMKLNAIGEDESDELGN